MGEVNLAELTLDELKALEQACYAFKNKLGLVMDDASKCMMMDVFQLLGDKAIVVDNLLLRLQAAKRELIRASEAGSAEAPS